MHRAILEGCITLPENSGQMVHRKVRFNVLILLSVGLHAPKFVDKCEEETANQERCARRDAWEMAKSVRELKERTMPHSIRFRKFGVSDGATMHMLSRKGLSGTRHYTSIQKRTTVVEACGEVQTNEEATMYVYDLDLFVTAPIVKDTPAFLSFGSLIMDTLMSGPVVKKHIS